MSNVLPFSRDQRRSTRTARGLGTRAKVESMKRLSRRDLEAGRVHLELVDNSGRPLTRGDCVDGPRPCPWVACSHNLFLDVTDTENIKFNFPDLEPEDVPAEKSCALDVAAQGGATLEDVACTMNVTRERVRQVEEKAIRIMRSRSQIRGSAMKVLAEFSDAPADAVVGTRGNGSGSVFKAKLEGAQRDEDEFAEDETPTRISFFAEPDSERVDELVTASVWRMFARWQNGRGFDCRSKQQIAQSNRMAHQRKLEERMGTELTPRLAAILDAYNALAAKGDKPRALDIATRAKVSGETDKVRAANVYTALGVLRKKGLLGAPLKAAKAEAVPQAPRAPRAPRSPRPPSPEASAPTQAPSRTRSADPTVSALISKRDDLRRKADALDTAIEALSVAL